MRSAIKLYTATLLLLMISPIISRGQDLSTPRAIFEANIEATGADAWSDVKTMHTVMEMVMDMEMATIIMTTESWIIRPDYMLTKMKMLEGPPGMPDGAGDNTIYISPNEGWVDGFQGRQELSSLPEEQREQMKTGMLGKEEVGLLARPDSVFTLLDSKEFDGSMVYVVELAGESVAHRYYDHNSLLLVGVESEMASPMGGTIKTTTVMSDYKTVDGVRIAHLIESEGVGIGTQTMTIKRIDINGDITPEKLAEMVR